MYWLLIQIDFQEKLDDVKIVDASVQLMAHEALDGLQVFFGAEALLKKTGPTVRLLVIFHDKQRWNEVAPRLAELIERKTVLAALLLDHLWTALQQSQHGTDLIEHRFAEPQHLEEFFDPCAGGVLLFLRERLACAQQQQDALQSFIDLQENRIGAWNIELVNENTIPANVDSGEIVSAYYDLSKYSILKM